MCVVDTAQTNSSTLVYVRVGGYVGMLVYNKLQDFEAEISHLFLKTCLANSSYDSRYVGI